MNTYSWSGSIVPVAGDSVVLGAVPRLVGVNASQGMLVRVLRVKVGPSLATAAGVQLVTLVLRSQADTVGTPTVQTPARFDQNDPAAQATLTTYAAVPTTGGTNQPLGAEQLASGATPAVGNLISWRWDDTMGVGANTGKVPLLRHFANGGAQPILALNFSAALAGQVCPVEIVWSEAGA